MKNINLNVACAGMDVHYKFSNVTFRDSSGKVVARQRLNHPDRKQLIKRIGLWPKGAPVVLEASFGWGWLSDLLIEAGLEPQLSVISKKYSSESSSFTTSTKKRL